MHQKRQRAAAAPARDATGDIVVRRRLRALAADLGAMRSAFSRRAAAVAAAARWGGGRCHEGSKSVPVGPLGYTHPSFRVLERNVCTVFVRRRRGMVLLVGESGAVVPLLRSAASDPWCLSHAGTGGRVCANATDVTMYIGLYRLFTFSFCGFIFSLWLSF